MRKPSPFVISDLFLLFGGILPAGLCLYILLSGAFSFEIIGMLSLISIVFFGFLGFQFFKRYLYLKSFTWYPEFNLMVRWNGYYHSNVGDYYKYIIDRWKAYYPNVEQIMKKDINWILFDKNMNDKLVYNVNRKVYGITFLGTRTMYVLYENANDNIENLAFAHEAGHVIRGQVTGRFNGDEDHAFFEKYGLGHIVMEKE